VNCRVNCTGWDEIRKIANWNEFPICLTLACSMYSYGLYADVEGGFYCLYWSVIFRRLSGKIFI